jgi:hypothetical protein
MTDEDEEGEWRFGVDEVGPDADDAEGSADTAGTPEGTAAHEGPNGGERPGSVAGSTDREMPVEPEPIHIESVVFVLLGVTVTLLVFAQFVVG